VTRPFQRYDKKIVSAVPFPIRTRPFIVRRKAPVCEIQVIADIALIRYAHNFGLMPPRSTFLGANVNVSPFCSFPFLFLCAAAVLRSRAAIYESILYKTAAIVMKRCGKPHRSILCME
jgi:hypothetical protein